MKCFLTIFLSYVSFLSINVVNARDQLVENLRLNKAKTVHLEAGEIFKYRINLQKGQFASIQVHQKSIGVGYVVYAPDGSLISSEDLNALYQTEVINITASKAGNYVIEIFWDYSRPQSGEYSIVWNMLETLGKTVPDRVEQLMKSWYNSKEAGAAVLILKNDKVIFKSTRGLANMEYQIPINSSSLFELASCSKQFTGFAIAMLLDKGLISLDDDIRKYLPELHDFGNKITIENLVYHTSGLRNWDDMTNAMGLRAEDALTIDMVYQMICNTSELNFAPNEKFAYSNTGYNLLALIIEKVTGEKFGSWMHENIFKPLRMNNTLVKDDIHKIIPNKVCSYKNGKDGFIANADNISAMGSTSIYSNINDLAIWATNFNLGKVGGKSVLTLLNRKSKFISGKDQNFYAFGNGFGNHKGIPNIEHLGLTSGFRTAISRYPEQHLTVIFLSNDNNDASYNHAWAIADLFLQNVKNKQLEPIKFPDLKQALAKTMPYNTERRPVETKEYEGIYYADEINSCYKLINKNGVLTAISYRFDSIDLKKEKADSFSSNFQTFIRSFEFLRDDNKNVSAFKLTGGDKDVVFRKMK